MQNNVIPFRSSPAGVRLVGYNASRQGAINREHGKVFEDLLSASFAYYEKAGLAKVEKTPEPMRPIRSLGHGQFVSCFEAKAQPDYKGTMKGGRSVVMEAKHSDKPIIERRRVTDAQEKEMDAHEALGALCYVVFGFANGKVYRLPWHMWKNMRQYFGRVHIKMSDPQLEDYRLNPSKDGILPLLEPGPDP